MKNLNLPLMSLTLVLCVLAQIVCANELLPPPSVIVEDYAVHGQATYTVQSANAFAASYAGTNSLSPSGRRATADFTVSLGAHLWDGAEAWLNPELDQGFGLNDTLGLAGFSSGEAYKVGRQRPYLRLQRAFIRQTLGLSGVRESIEAGANQLSGTRLHDRIVITVGKFNVTDIFDTNQYAHDARGDFLNWSVIDGGAFDYAADAWGYTVGAAVEWYHSEWVVRGGLMDLSNVPNSAHLEPALHEFQWLFELEHQHQVGDRQGKILVTAFDSRGRMGLLSDALKLADITGQTPDVAMVRRYRGRTGLGLNIEQQLQDDVGAFVRASSAGGNVETYEFTDIDRSFVLGVALKGTRWGRAADTVGCALVTNQISSSRQQYFARGGLGILVGDGQLPHAAPERILETYYSASPFKHLQLTFDYQHVANPAYNSDRGPVSIVSLRAHSQF